MYILYKKIFNFKIQADNRFHIGSLNRVQNSHLLKEKRITYTPNVIRGRFNKAPEDKNFIKALSHNKKLVNVLKTKMFKGYGKVNMILHEKLNSVSVLKNNSQNNLLKSQELNRLERIRESRGAETMKSNELNYKNDEFEDNVPENNFNKLLEEQEKQGILNPSMCHNVTNRENNIDHLKNKDIEKAKISSNNNKFFSSNPKENERQIKTSRNQEETKTKNSKKLKKILKDKTDKENTLLLHVDHFPKANTKSVKMRDQVTDMYEEQNSQHQLFLTQKNSEIFDSSIVKNKFLNNLKNKHKIKNYISDISQVNQIKFFAFDVKNPGYKEHFNNKMVQIEKEILKEIEQINKEHDKKFDAENEKTLDFFDIDKSKLFDQTKKLNNLYNPNFYGRPTSKQNFKTNPGLVRGFLRNFKNNKLLTEFFKYKKEKEKRERFNIQTNEFSTSHNFGGTNSNTDYVETYYIGKNNKNKNKIASMTQNEFMKNNEINKMQKYFEMLNQQRINEEDEINYFNNLNQELYINKDFIKEFNEYAYSHVNGELHSNKDNLKPNEEFSNAENNINNSSNNNNKLEIKKILNENIDSQLLSGKKNNVTSDYLSNEKKKISGNYQIENITDSLKNQSSPVPILHSHSNYPQKFRFNYSDEKHKFLKVKELNYDEKYIEEHYYEEPINEEEIKRIMLKINDPNFNKDRGFVRERDTAFFKKRTNYIDLQSQLDNEEEKEEDLKFLQNSNMKEENQENKFSKLDSPIRQAFIVKEKSEEDYFDDSSDDRNERKRERIEKRKKNRISINSIIENKNQKSENQEDPVSGNLIINQLKDIKEGKIKSSETTNNICQVKDESKINLELIDNKIQINKLHENNLLNNFNFNIEIKNSTIENPTEILQSGLSFEDQNNKNLKDGHDNENNLYQNYALNSDIYKDKVISREQSPPSFLKANLEGSISNNKYYENLKKRNNPNNIMNINKNKKTIVKSLQTDYYKPLTEKIAKNDLRNIQKSKFNKLKDIVFGFEDEEYKSNMIRDNNQNINNIYHKKLNPPNLYDKKPTTAPANTTYKSPLRSLISNQMEVYMKNQNN